LAQWKWRATTAFEESRINRLWGEQLYTARVTCKVSLEAQTTK
jgi:hypothetical protein